MYSISRFLMDSNHCKLLPLPRILYENTTTAAFDTYTYVPVPFNFYTSRNPTIRHSPLLIHSPLLSLTLPLSHTYNPPRKLPPNQSPEPSPHPLLYKQSPPSASCTNPAASAAACRVLCQVPTPTTLDRPDRFQNSLPPQAGAETESQVEVEVEAEVHPVKVEVEVHPVEAEALQQRKRRRRSGDLRAPR